MSFSKMKSDYVKISFTISGLCAEICNAALSGPTPYYQLGDIVREAIFQWGIVNTVREKNGGLRLLRDGFAPSPFGHNREIEILSAARTDSGRNGYRTCVNGPSLLEEILKTATEDTPSRFESRSEVINIAIIQWGLTHLELAFEDGVWDFKRPLELRQAFDFDPKMPSLKAASLRPFDITAKEDLFPPAAKGEGELAGSVAVPFYRPDADLGYLDKVSAGEPTKVASAASAQEAEAEAGEIEAARRELLAMMEEDI